MSPSFDNYSCTIHVFMKGLNKAVLDKSKYLDIFLNNKFRHMWSIYVLFNLNIYTELHQKVYHTMTKIWTWRAISICLLSYISFFNLLCRTVHMIKNKQYFSFLSVTMNPLINEIGLSMGAEGNECTMHYKRWINTPNFD